MRKLCFVVTALLLAAPALATVQITCHQIVGQDPPEVAVDYNAVSDGNLPRAFGLNITVDSNEVISAITAVNDKFWVYPGTIQIVGGVIIDQGDPVAPQDSNHPGRELGGIGTGGMTIEMGSLYDPCDPCHPTGPALSGELLRFTISPGTKPDANVTITGNAARGNVVLENTEEAATSYTGCVVNFDCFYEGMVDGCGHVVTAAEVAIWAGLTPSKPACWCYPCHCRGDADNTCTITGTDIQNSRNAWPGAPVYGTYNPCADTDYTGTITGTDIQAIRNAWPGAPVYGPGCSGVTGCP
jgi:hypothetical protein